MSSKKPENPSESTAASSNDPLVAQLTTLIESLEAKHSQQAKAQEIPADVPHFESWQ